MSGNKGFSLIELLVVLGIMGILMAISAPGVIEWRRNAQFKEAAQLAASTLRQAKGQAINVNQKVIVKFTLDDNAANENNSVVMGAGTPMSFGKGIEVRGKADCTKTTGELVITFNPNGSASTVDGAYICIFDGLEKKYRTGFVNSMTGRVVLQKWQDGTWK